MPVKNKMASAELMRAGVRVTFASLLNEVSTLLEKGEETEIWLRKDMD
jgi:hypothetical protein